MIITLSNELPYTNILYFSRSSNSLIYFYLYIMKLYLCSLLLIFSFFSWFSSVSAASVEFNKIGNNSIKNITDNTFKSSITIWEDPIKNIESAGFSILFNAFNSQTSTIIDTRISYISWFKTPGQESNIFYDVFNLWYTLNNDIIGFMEILISFIAILVIILAWIKMILSRWEEEVIKESKNKILWSIISLILVWFIESWKYLVFSGEVSDGTTFFETLTNLLFFFAGPVAMAFLTLAAYTYITANGDEDKLKKAKSIVINVILATVILLASYTFLLDLITL